MNLLKACFAVQAEETETFDAVVCCVGTYHAPNLPDLKGLRLFPGQQMHCHNFRHKDSFKDESVLVVGASFSGTMFWPVVTTISVTSEYSREVGSTTTISLSDLQALANNLMRLQSEAY